MNPNLLIFRPEAESDALASYRWYQQQQRGLGDEFLEALDNVVLRIERQPEQFPVVHQTIRRALFKRFPYAVFFILNGQQIAVLAVMHQAKNPKHWRDRG